MIFRHFILFCLTAVFINFAFSQNVILLDSEIQKVEKITVSSGINANDKHDAYLRLARLKQLSGDMEGAASAWLEAAASAPGAVDDNALLSCAFCLAAMGEWDRACIALEPLLPKLPRANLLYSSINAIKTGDTSALMMLAANPQYLNLKSEIYFILWKLSSGQTANSWKNKLLAEFPQSPESHIASGGNASSIIVNPSPFWLLIKGADLYLPPAAVSRQVDTSIKSETAIISETSIKTETSIQTSPAIQGGVTQTKIIQTGAFSIKENAQNEIEKLRRAGFSPSMEMRIINEKELWVVTVPSGIDIDMTISSLRAVGFNSVIIR